jgi:FkbM family methyltransferase
MRKNQKVKYYLKNPHHAVWHPEQGLYNEVTSYVFGEHIRPLIYSLDTLVRAIQAVSRRIKLCGIKNTVKNSPFLDKLTERVFYIDAGLHRKPQEMLNVVNWFGKRVELSVIGIEAHPEFLSSAREFVSNEIPNFTNVKLINTALVGPNKSEDSVKLHVPNDGKGEDASLLEDRGGDEIYVRSRKLSNIIDECGIAPSRDILLIRMNIEGSEDLVLKDLQSNGILKSVDGYYGSWDDVYDLKPSDVDSFRKMMKQQDIRPFPFNSRDVTLSTKKSIRESVIKYDMVTSILHGAK